MKIAVHATTTSTPRNKHSHSSSAQSEPILIGIAQPRRVTPGAGFCCNIGRIAAAVGTIDLGTYGQSGDYCLALYYTSPLFIPVAAFALMLPELPLVRGRVEPEE